MRILLSILFILALGQVRSQNQTYYPDDVQWANIKTVYGAVGDGITDDTEAFKTAVATKLNPFNSAISIYIPEGTYLVSDSINFLSSFFSCCLTLQGENRETTIIKLADNLPAFQDPGNPLPIFRTRGGNQAFGNYCSNLTISVGSGNPGAVGFDYITSNSGAIRNTTIKSEDGAGFCGLRMERNWPGPGMVKDVEIIGFDYGLRIGTCEYSMTFEDFTLTNQNIYGIRNVCNTVSMRHVVSNNSVPAIYNQGRFILLDSELNGGIATNEAIENIGNSFLFARNITASGYGNIIEDDGTLIGTDYIEEYRNKSDFSLNANDGKSLGLPIEETPKYINNNASDWVNVADFGAAPTNPQFAFLDATEEIQAAFNSGAKAFYFAQLGDNSSGYCIYADIIIPPTVEYITGFHTGKFRFFNDSKFVINEDAATPLFISQIRGTSLQNNSQRTLVATDLTSSKFSNTAANSGGKVFLDAWVSPFTPEYPVEMWARQLNTEVQPQDALNINNPGGKTWILGLKTEGRAQIVRTTNGGATEVLGALVYPSSSFQENEQAAFYAEDACTSIVGLTMTSYVTNGWYDFAFEEVREGVSQVLEAGTIWADTPYNFSFYATDQNYCANFFNCDGDFNQDEAINTQDLLFLIAELGCETNCSADMNSDEQVTTSDLLLLISKLGSPCGF